jgi:hypothetical protein
MNQKDAKTFFFSGVESGMKKKVVAYEKWSA